MDIGPINFNGFVRVKSWPCTMCLKSWLVVESCMKTCSSSDFDGAGLRSKVHRWSGRGEYVVIHSIVNEKHLIVKLNSFGLRNTMIHHCPCQLYNKVFLSFLSIPDRHVPVAARISSPWQQNPRCLSDWDPEFFKMLHRGGIIMSSVSVCMCRNDPVSTCGCCVWVVLWTLMKQCAHVTRFQQLTKK